MRLFKLWRRFWGARASIVRPRVNIPVIAMPGESFGLWCDDLYSANGLEVSLVKGDRLIPLMVKSAKYEKVVYDEITGAYYDWNIEVVVPKNVRAGLYDIQISSGKSEIRNVRSVKIVSSYKRNFRFVQVTDTHIGHPDIQKYSPKLKGILEAVKAKRPEFIVITGDCIHDTGAPGKKATAGELWAEFLDYFKDLEIPIYVVPGNHDFRGKANRHKEYLKYMGPRYYSFNYGENHFLMLDNALDTSNEQPVPPDYVQQLKWADRDLAAHSSSKLKVVSQHINYKVGQVADRERLWGVVQMPEEFLEFCDKHSVDLLVDGHIHGNGEKQLGQTPTLHLTTGTSSSNYVPTDIGNGWYRVIDVKDGRIESALCQK